MRLSAFTKMLLVLDIKNSYVVGTTVFFYVYLKNNNNNTSSVVYNRQLTKCLFEQESF